MHPALVGISTFFYNQVLVENRNGANFLLASLRGQLLRFLATLYGVTAKNATDASCQFYWLLVSSKYNFVKVPRKFIVARLSICKDP